MNESVCVDDACTSTKLVARGRCSKHYYHWRKANHKVTVTEATCNTCHQTKAADEFYNDYMSKTGLASMCKECCGLRDKARRYGLTTIQLREWYESVGGRCEVCLIEESITRLCVDHDSTCCPSVNNTKKCGECNRGLLCQGCNTLLGYAEDNPSTLRNAAKYVEERL